MRLSYRLTEDEKVQIMHQKLRPQDIVRRAHDVRHEKHKRMAPRPPKPAPSGPLRRLKLRVRYWAWDPTIRLEPKEATSEITLTIDLRPTIWWP